MWKNTLRGLIFSFLWYSSILFNVIYIYSPCLILLLINRKWFRKCMDIILASWELYPAALLEIFVGCKVSLTGDSINPADGAILMMNHRNRLDWFFLWAGLLQGTKPPAHRSKFVLKSDVRHIPGIGWGLQMAGFLYIYRNWARDQVLLKDSLDYFRDLDNKYQILLFVEGTNISHDTLTKSNAFAQKNGLPPYKYVLHPRTTGFSFLVETMRENCQINSVYDLTIAYPATLPLSEKDILLRGKIPEEVHFNIKRYEISSLPKDEEGLKKWCEDRWKEKENSLEKFYTSPQGERRFPGLKLNSPEQQIIWNSQWFAFIVWTLFTFYLIYIFFTSSIAFWWAIFISLTHIIISISTDGIQQLEISLWKRFDRLQMNSKKAD